MVHLVSCDNQYKKGMRPLEKNNGIKTMVIRWVAGRKIPHNRVFVGDRLYLWKRDQK